MLTVVLNPDPAEDGAWHVRTACQASDAQVGRYRQRPLRVHDGAMQIDDEITSDELDGLLGQAETLSAAGAARGTKVRLYVALAPPNRAQRSSRLSALEGHRCALAGAV